jgi:hypothetical protein
LNYKLINLNLSPFDVHLPNKKFLSRLISLVEFNIFRRENDRIPLPFSILRADSHNTFTLMDISNSQEFRRELKSELFYTRNTILILPFSLFTN